MIDQDKLNDVYTGGESDEFRPKLPTGRGPGPKKPLIGFDRPAAGTLNLTQGSDVNLRTPDHQKFFGEHGTPNPQVTGEDLGIIMGHRQSVGNKLARRMGNLVPNIASGLVDMAGSLGSLLTEFGDDRDYHNGLNEAADAIKNPFGEAYARSHDTWAIGDPTWWINHAFNVGEIATSFALGGAGAARVLGGAAKLMGGSALTMKAAQFGTSALVSFSESAMAGSDVFQEVYEAQVQKLLSEGRSPIEAMREAKHIASQSAATTAQLGTILTMGLNVGAYGGLFKSQTEIAKDIIARRIATSESQAFGNVAQAVRGLNAEDYLDKLIHHGGIKSVLAEMNQEGWEEVFQQFAQVTGSEMGKDGEMKGFFEQFGELENLIDRTGNSEGLLSFTLGAAFGGLQHVLLNNVIPSKRVAKLDDNGSPIPVYKEDGETIQTDKNGNPVVEKHWVTPRRYERDFTVQTFDSLKEAVASDYEKQVELESEYLQAVKDGKVIEAEEARDKLFDPTRLHAIRNGMSEPWIRTFEEIGALDNSNLDENGQTEAMRRGYAESPGTAEHTEMAKKTIEGIKHLTSVYQTLQDTYGTKYESNAHVKPFVDMVFAREADLYDVKQRIDKFEKVLADERKRENELAQLLDPDGFGEAINNHNAALMSAQEVDKGLAKDQETLMSGDPKKINRLLKKYRAIGMGNGDTKDALNTLRQKLSDARNRLGKKIKDSENSLFVTPEYIEWLEKNPTKSFDDFVEEVNKRSGLTLQNHALATQLETHKTNYNIAREHLREMTAEKNAQRFMKTVGEWQDKLRKEAERVEKKNTEKMAAMLKDKNALSKLDKIELNRIAEEYLGMAEKLEEQVEENKQRIRTAQKELDALSGDWFRARALRSQIKKLEKENIKLEARIKQLRSLYVKYSVDMAPVTEDTDKDDITEDDDLDEDDYVDEKDTDDVPFTEETGGMDENDLLEYGNEEDTSTEEETTEDPMEDFTDILEGLTNKSLKKKVNSIVKKLIDNKLEFSLDLLNNEIDKGWIEQAAANKLLKAAQKFVNEAKALLAVESTATETATETTVTPTIARLEDIQNRIIVSGTDGGFRLINSFNRNNENAGTVIDVRRPDSDEKYEVILGEGEDQKSLFGDIKFGKKNSYHYRIRDKKTGDLFYIVGISNRVLGSSLNDERNGSVFVSVKDDGNLPTNIRTLLELKLIEEFQKLNVSRPDVFDKLPQSFIDKTNAQYAAELKAPVAVKKTTRKKKTPPKPKPEVKTTGPDAPDTPPIDNADPDTDVVPQSTAFHAGKKRLSALAGASSTIAYEEGTKRDKKGTKMFVKVTKPSELLRPASKLLLLPGHLKPNHPVRLEVHVDYDGPKHITDSLSWDEEGNVVMEHEKGTDYLDEQNKVRSNPQDVGNVPIRVVDAVTGEFITHIPTLRWIEMKFPGTTDYRNIVEFIELSDGTVIENLEIEREKLMEMRSIIVEQYNSTGTAVESKVDVQGKGTGTVIRNYEVQEKGPKAENKYDDLMAIKSKIVPKLAYNAKDPDASLLPGEVELVITIDPGGIPYSGAGFPTNKELGFDTKELQKGYVGALVPGANGQMMYAPLIGRKLVTGNKPSLALNSVVRVMELYLLNDGSNPKITEEITQLKKDTGFDVGTSKGLRGFINQYYTYMNGFKDSDLSPSANNGDNIEQFLFNVNDLDVLDKSKRIKAGFAMRGDGAHYAKIVDGRLDEKFVEVLREGFQERSQAVVFSDTSLGLTGINSPKKFVSASYTSKGWSHKEYKNYNQYVKGFSMTSVYGRNQLDGQYVYTANPIVPIAMPPRIAGALVEPNNTAETVTPIIDSTAEDQELDDFDALIAPSNLKLKRTTAKAIGTAPDNSKPLTEQTLRDLYNFTAEVERNGKTVLGVLQELTSRGHNFIPDGFNPFSRCL